MCKVVYVMICELHNVRGLFFFILFFFVRCNSAKKESNLVFTLYYKTDNGHLDVIKVLYLYLISQWKGKLMVDMYG